LAFIFLHPHKLIKPYQQSSLPILGTVRAKLGISRLYYKNGNKYDTGGDDDLLQLHGTIAMK
jgi:hypothetical protein